MNLRELLSAYSDMKSALAAPELRSMMDEIPQRMQLPKKAYKQMKDHGRAKELTDLIGRYTGVHPENMNLKDENGYTELGNALLDYSDVGYRPINKVFRDPFGLSMDPYRTDNARIMMDSFKPSANDMVVYRGLPEGNTLNALNSLDRRGELNNNQLGNKGFMSTSLDPYVANSFFSKTQSSINNFRIMLPKGTPVLPVHNGMDVKSLSPELEYILPPNSRYARLPRSMGDDYTDLLMTEPGQMKEPAYIPDQPGVGWLAGMLPLAGLPGMNEEGKKDNHYAKGGQVEEQSSGGDSPSFSDLVAMANNPGPMQGMAQALLRQIADESGAADARTERTGMRASPANGPEGLNFSDPTPARGNYPSELASSLINRYGAVASAPRGESSTPDITPHPEAVAAYDSAMDEFEPSMWEKIKNVARSVYDNPHMLAEPIADVAAYGTPMIGNSKGVLDWKSDWEDMERYAANPHTDGFGTLAAYAPRLTMDLAQTVLPLGWREAPERGIPTMMEMLKKYGGGNIVKPAFQTAARGLFQ